MQKPDLAESKSTEDKLIALISEFVPLDLSPVEVFHYIRLEFVLREKDGQGRVKRIIEVGDPF